MDWNTITPIATFILGLLSKFLYDWWQEKRRLRKERLRIHFNDIKELLTGAILPMSRNLQIEKGRLIFGDHTPVYESYDFEDIGIYTSFRLHFPEFEREWKQLNEKALNLKERLKHFDDKTDWEYRSLRTNYMDFYWRLKILIENMEKFGINYQTKEGFRKIKGCPFCEDF